MSTILIDRRTAALLGELAAQPAPPLTPGAAVRRPQRSSPRPEVREARPEARALVRAKATRPSAEVRRTNSGAAESVTVRRPAAGGASVRRTLRCRPAAEGPRIAVEVTPRRRPSRPAGAPKPTLHLTRRGRLVAFLFLFVLVTLAFSVGRVTTTALGAADAPGQQVVVQQGDTLWSIAERIAPDTDPRKVASELMAVNGLGSPSLEVGQHLRLP